MKLATLADGSRDGRLVRVADDLSACVPTPETIPTLQAALDDWAGHASILKPLRPDEPFDPAQAMAVLPRAYQWADGSAYVNHVALVRRARGAEMPESFWTDPLMYQGGSDSFLAPLAEIRMPDAGWGIDFEAEIAVITGDVPMGCSREEALEHIRLILLVNDVSLRNLIPAELAKGFGFFQSKPSSSLSPVAVTPDGLGAAWRDGRLHGVLEVDLNGQPFGRADAGVDMVFDFGTLIAHAAKTRPLAAGSIIGSGTVSNRDADGGPGRPVAEGGRGYSCIAEQRVVETILHGAPRTPFLQDGDEVAIRMRDAAGRSIFGEIRNRVRIG